jgi:outer membrane protein TolC
VQHNRVNQAKQAVRSARGGYYPSLSFQADFASPPLSPAGSSPVSKKPFGQSYYFSGQLSLNWDIFNSFRTLNQVRSQKSLLQAANINLQQLYANTKKIVRDQLYDIEASLYNYIASDLSVSLAKEGVEQALIQVNVGTITPLDLRTAIVNLSQARTNRNTSLFDLLIHFYELLYLTGNTDLSSEMEV